MLKHTSLCQVYGMSVHALDPPAHAPETRSMSAYAQSLTKCLPRSTLQKVVCEISHGHAIGFSARDPLLSAHVQGPITSANV